MGRPALGDKAMTAAERKARSRAMKTGELVGYAEILRGMVDRLITTEKLSADGRETLERARSMSYLIAELAKKA